jgi:hypothetical protein
MGDILKKKKLAVHKFEVIPYALDRKYEKILTIKRLVTIAKGNKVLEKYLPDDADKHVTKEWLVSLINTIDQSLFPKLIQEIDAQNVKSKPRKLEDTL